MNCIFSISRETHVVCFITLFARPRRRVEDQGQRRVPFLSTNALFAQKVGDDWQTFTLKMQSGWIAYWESEIDGRAHERVRVYVEYIRRWAAYPVEGCNAGLREPLRARMHTCTRERVHM